MDEKNEKLRNIYIMGTLFPNKVSLEAITEIYRKFAEQNNLDYNDVSREFANGFQGLGFGFKAQKMSDILVEQRNRGGLNHASIS